MVLSPPLPPLADSRGQGVFYPLPATTSDTSTLGPVGNSKEIEYFFASDARYDSVHEFMSTCAHVLSIIVIFYNYLSCGVLLFLLHLLIIIIIIVIIIIIIIIIIIFLIFLFLFINEYSLVQLKFIPCKPPTIATAPSSITPTKCSTWRTMTWRQSARQAS